MPNYKPSLGCLVLTVPTTSNGAVVTCTGRFPLEHKGRLDSITMQQHFWPPAVYSVNRRAVSVAVMLSADSTVFSAASMFAHNVVNSLFPTASEHCILSAMKDSILLVGDLAEPSQYYGQMCLRFVVLLLLSCPCHPFPSTSNSPLCSLR